LNVIKQSAEIVHISHPNPDLFIEDSARICWQSHKKTTYGTAERMISMLKAKGHLTPLEFVDVIVDITTNRAISHQLVRHRHCSILQESQRYVRYDGSGINVIEPVGYNPEERKWKIWGDIMQSSDDAYCEMIALGAAPQEARGVLTNATATKLRIKANCREWLHIFALRNHPAADPQMVDLMCGLYMDMHLAIPSLFGGRKEHGNA